MKTTGTIEAATGLWYSPNTGATNSSGFSVAPGGGRFGNGGYNNVGDSGYWWSSSEADTGIAWNRKLYYDFDEAFWTGIVKRSGFSVRCLRD